MTSLERAQRFVWEVQDAQADETERAPLGTALRSPSIPRAFDVNLLRIEEATASRTWHARRPAGRSAGRS